MTSEPEAISGWLLKWTNVLKGYQKRWFLVQNNLLSYYRNRETVGKRCRGTIDLSNAHISAPKSQSSFVLIDSSGRKHHLKALSEEDKEKWLAILNKAIVQADPFQNEVESDDYAPSISQSDNPSNTDPHHSIRNHFRGRSKLGCAQPNVPNNNPAQPCLSRKRSTSGSKSASRDRSSTGAPTTNKQQSTTHGNSSPILFPTDHHESLKDPKESGKSDTIKRLCRQSTTCDDSLLMELLAKSLDFKRNLQTKANYLYSQASDLEAQLQELGNDGHAENTKPNHSGQLDHRILVMRAALQDHTKGVKEFQEVCNDALEFLTSTCDRWHRRIMYEQDLRFGMERTVKQLAKQHRALEIQLGNSYAASIEELNNMDPTSRLVRGETLPRSVYNGGGGGVGSRIQVTSASLDLSAKPTMENHRSSVYYEVDESEDRYFDALSSSFNSIEDRGLNPTQSPSSNLSVPSNEGLRASVTSLCSLVNAEESSTDDSEDESLNIRKHLPYSSHSSLNDGHHKSKQAEENQTKPVTSSVRKRRTSIPPSPKIALNLWSIIKNAIGKDVTKIPLPVNFNEPLSFLQRAVEDFTYSKLLDQAAQTTDPVEQMALVAAFSVSCYATTAIRTGKPFNSLLGETYECDRTDDYGWRCISEQVSHHPPGCSQHCESVRYGWKVWQDFFLVTKFRGKYLSVFPKGTVNLLFADGTHYTWTKVTTVVHNLIVGTLWIDNYGDIEIKNHTKNYSCPLHFIAHSYFSRGPPKRVTGLIKNPSDTPVRIVQGTWDEYMECLPCNAEGEPTGDSKLLWKAEKLPPNAEDVYNFSQFTIELNEMEEGVAPTDSRRRPDQRLMEQGLWDQANEEKRRLEAKQRAKRHAWEKATMNGASSEPLFTPVWFVQKMDPITAEPIHVYLNNYWEAKTKQTWDACPDIY